MRVVIDMDADISKKLDVAAGNPAPWAYMETQIVTCSGLGCKSVETGTIVHDTSGTIPQPGVLYQMGDTYFIRTDGTLVLERQ